MKKILLPLILFLLFISKSNAQVPVFDWVSVIGGELDGGWGKEYTLDNKGNSITMNSLTGSADFDPDTSTYILTASTWDAVISKLDSNGNFVWAKLFLANTFYADYKVSTDSFRNVYVTGKFNNTMDFDPNSSVYNLTATGTTDNFILKLNEEGNFVWAKKIGNTNVNGISKIAADQTGNIYFTGGFQDTVDFDLNAGIYNLISNDSIDIYMCSLDSGGNFLWAKNIGGNSFDVGYSIALDYSGNIYMNGLFSDSVDFNPGVGTYNLVSDSDYCYFQSKFDSAGNFIWAIKLFDKTTISIRTVEVDKEGNMYFAGEFSDTIDFDSGVGIANLYSGDIDNYMLKIDSASNFLWVRQLGGSSIFSARITDVGFDVEGNFYSIGLFYFTQDFDPDTSIYILTPYCIAPEFGDVFILKLSSSGNFQWVKNIGGVNGGNYDEEAIEISESNNIYSMGNFIGTVDFDPGSGIDTITGSGYYSSGSFGPGDIFVHKMSQCNSTFGNITISTCNSFVSPSGFYTWSTSGIYNDVIPNSDGCDSLITINLTITNNTNSTINPVTCNNYNSPSGNYTWSNTGIYSDTIPNFSGCDSVITINLTNNNSFAVVNANACVNYISPSGNYTWTNTGIYFDTIPNSFGCDSLLTIHLSINTTFANINVAACENYISPSGNYIASVSGILHDTIPNTNGCDSILTINLTVNHNSSSIQTITSCNNYTSPSGNYTWTTSGIYSDTIPNTTGCDSLITLNLTINNNSNSSQTISACNYFTSPSGNHTWSVSGIYTDVLINSVGCDSVITTNLTINTVNIVVGQTAETLISNASTGTYQWLDCDNGFAIISGATNQIFTATANGNFAVAVTQNGCTDTSVCYSVTGVGINEPENSESGFQIFPNPANEQFTVISKQQAEYKITIINMLGEIIYEKAENHNSQNVNLKLFSQGIYLVQLQSPDFIKIKKLIVVK